MARTLNLLFTTLMLIGLSSCASINAYNPFGSGANNPSKLPANTTAYLCEGNKQFYVRLQNNGNDAWLIYPDHEVNLNKSMDNPNRFTSGAITLVINGAETTLNDGERIAYQQCKPKPKVQ